MNKQIFIILIIGIVMLMIPSFSNATTSLNYTIIENGLPAGTSWEYNANGINYTTTNNVVYVNGSFAIYPQYSYTMNENIVGNTVYLNYTPINSAFTLQKIIPYAIIGIVIIGILSVVLIIRRKINEY